jgi:Cof subfamily protein (haloacid dehalogenase superfamily)
MDIKLLVLDMDGTLVDRSDRIQDAVLHAIHQVHQQGVAVAIATGRGFQLSLPIYDAIGSTSPLICYDGALIKDPRTGLVHQHWSLARPVVEELLDFVDKPSLSGRVSIHFYIEDRLYVSNMNDAASRYFEDSKIEPIVVGELGPLLNQAITKFRVLSDDDELVIELFNRVKNVESRIRLKEYRSLTYLEVDNPAVNKRHAVSYLAEVIMGLQRENVMAVGNDLGDIEMLRYAGLGVAMGNAAQAVQESADWVTATIEEYGVARAIESWILSERAGSMSTSVYGGWSTTDLNPDLVTVN